MNADTSVMIRGYHGRTNARRNSSTSRHLTNELVARVHTTNNDFRGVDDRIDRLALLCEAMWELLIEKTDISEEDLQKKVAALDEVDGRKNFRRQRVAAPCECGAKVPPARLTCQFCGAPATGRSIFDAV